VVDAGNDQRRGRLRRDQPVDDLADAALAVADSRAAGVEKILAVEEVLGSAAPSGALGCSVDWRQQDADGARVVDDPAR
jgi:hypothetical protein